MGTILDTMNAAGRNAGIIQQNEVLTGENLTVVNRALKTFTDYCSNNDLLVYYRSQQEFTLVNGQVSYTLGIGGDWDIPRPMKIEKLMMRLNPGSPQQLDIRCEPLTYSQYADVAVKNTPSQWAFAYYDDNNYPLRNIYMFPVPTGPAQVLMWLREPLIDMSQNSVAAYGPIQGGTGYPDGFYPNIRLGGGSGSGAVADITVLNGAVNNVVLKSGGEGYSVNDVLTISPISVGNNIITGTSITGTGSGYTDGTYYGVTVLGGGAGTGAKATVVVSGGAVTTFTITDGGQGYTTSEVLYIPGGIGPGTGFQGLVTSTSSALAGSGFAIAVTLVSANLSTPVNYPPGYEYFFEWNLTRRILPQFGKKEREDVKEFALEGKQALETLNMVPVFTRGDSGMSRSGRQRYFNWITGNFWSFGNN